MELIPNERLFRTENLVYDGQKVWAKMCWFNDLLEIDRETGEARTIHLPEEYDEKTWAHRCINKQGRKIYIVPFRARELIIFDLDTEEFESVALPDGVFEEGQTEGFAQSAIIDDHLVMFGYYPVFVLYNISTHEFEIVKGIKELFPADFDPKVWFCSWVVDGADIIIHILGTNKAFKFNVKSKAMVVYKALEYSIIDGVSDYSGGRIISPFNQNGDARIIVWDQEGKTIREYVVPNTSTDSIRAFSWITKVGNEIYMLPGSMEDALVLNLDDGQITKISDVPVISKLKMEERKKEIALNYFAYAQMGTLNCSTYDKHLLSVHIWSGALVDIDTNNGKVTSLDIVLDNFSRRRLEFVYMKRVGVNEEYYNGRDEKHCFGELQGFISFVTNHVDSKDKDY